MANYNTTANVVLTVNGKQAQRMLSTLEKDAARLEKQLASAALAGDKATMKKLQREITSTNKMIDQLKGTAVSADNVLRRLDTASPKELNKALRQLQGQLNGIHRGTAAWDAHVAKIRMLKAELAKVNATMATQQSMWTRFNNWLNNASTAIMGIAAAVTGMVMAGRKAVNAYAEMEEQLANTRKYTRMTEEDVLKLNDAFKNMDTRLAREQLNLLAQEGGRLGYNTVDKVKEYVEAASIINVALVDLGEGATQTIAKLSTIFGMEEMYGVKDAMLKIGSTVNHLSQNCTAAKPYLVNFAQRLAGIGATAKMSIPEILAFGATLDAHGQKVEMSATALQRVILKLFQAPEEMAKKVGLDVQNFITTLNRSTTDGVIMFLNQLKEIGSDKALAVLSPMFKDLGLDGARVAAVITTLSEHLDFLKWQMGEATQAFREGSSASNEYAIFNNTVQASIDKARKRVSELAIELGEKLYPLMRHIYTSSSVFLRVLSQIVDFIIRWRVQILVATSAVAGYYTVLALLWVNQLRLNVATKLSIVLQKSWRAAVILSKITALSFTNGIKASTRAMKLFNRTLKSNPYGLIIAALVAIATAVVAMLPKMDAFKKKVQESVKAAGDYSESLVKEQHELDTLFGKLKSTKKGTEEYETAKKNIISQYGKYLSGLISEEGEIINLKRAYDRLASSIKRANQERGIDKAQEEIDTEYYKSFATDLTLLQNQLEAYGASVIEAAELTEKVNRAVTQNVKLDPETKERIEELSANKPTKDVNGKKLSGGASRLANSAFYKFGLNSPQPSEVVNKLMGRLDERNKGTSALESMRDAIAPLRHADRGSLELAVESLQAVVDSGKSGSALVYDEKQIFKYIDVTVKKAEKLIEEYSDEIAYRNGKSNDAEIIPGNPDFKFSDYDKYETDADRRKKEAEERRRKIKERKEFKEKINSAKGDWESADATNTAEYTQGLKSYNDYLLQKHNLEIKYFNDRIKIFEDNNLQEDEDYQELLKKKEECIKAWNAKSAKLSIDAIKKAQQSEETQVQMDAATRGNVLYNNDAAVQAKLFKIKCKYLAEYRDLYNRDSEEYIEYQRKLDEAQEADKLRLQKLYASKIKEWRAKYDYENAVDRLALELELLDEIYDAKLISEEEYLKAFSDLTDKYGKDAMPENAYFENEAHERAKREKAMNEELAQLKSMYEQGLISETEYEEGKARIERAYRKKSLDAVRQFGSSETNQLLDIYEAWKKFFEDTEEDGGNWATRLSALAASVFAVMSAGMQQYSEYVQACADLETAKAEKRYDREIELAEGNTYKTTKLEKEKEEELARIKNEANRKAYAMEVIQAVAQTAINALNAYGSAAQVPVIGYILAPIAAAMAIAAGAIQVATIKKQQQASEAQGYSEGGFTPDGQKEEAVGVVHAGEWVASQRLTKNPQTRPLLEALDYAQRNNTIGSIRMSDVSRSINAPAMLAQSAATPTPTIVTKTDNQVSSTDNSELSSTLRELKERLNQPFVTVNTVTGDLGIKKAQDEYAKLISNKSPKSRKS
jgi:TP901 family phage tail tape measure protein